MIYNISDESEGLEPNTLRWEAMDEYRLENGFEEGFGPCQVGVAGESFRGEFGGGMGGRGMMGGFGTQQPSYQ